MRFVSVLGILDIARSVFRVWCGIEARGDSEYGQLELVGLGADGVARDDARA